MKKVLDLDTFHHKLCGIIEFDCKEYIIYNQTLETADPIYTSRYSVSYDNSLRPGSTPMCIIKNLWSQVISQNKLYLNTKYPNKIGSSNGITIKSLFKCDELCQSNYNNLIEYCTKYEDEYNFVKYGMILVVFILIILIHVLMVKCLESENNTR